MSIADGSNYKVKGKGAATVSERLNLKNVLLVPNLSCNLMSVKKITEAYKLPGNFFS